MKKTYITPEFELLKVYTESMILGYSENKVGTAIVHDTTSGINIEQLEIGKDDQEVDGDLAKRHTRWEW